MLVLNNEVRFPLVSIVDGVVFGDIGNVYPSLSDFWLSNLRESAGAGLRVRTPWFLIPGDYGVLLDRRARGTARPVLFQHRAGVLIAKNRVNRAINSSSVVRKVSPHPACQHPSAGSRFKLLVIAAGKSRARYRPISGSAW